MNRFQKVQKLFNKKDDLTITNKLYKQWVFRYTFLELEKDLSENDDITSIACIPSDAKARAKVITRDNGIVSGIEEIEYFLSEKTQSFRPRLGNLTVKSHKKDGDTINKNDTILEFEGFLKDILKSERIILNLLAHMSGISTATFKISTRIKEINNELLIVPTRKTTWGLLDKKAVTLGGGGTHRLNLSDAILVKDNHLAFYKNNLKELFLNLTVPNIDIAFFEVEADSPELAEKLAALLWEIKSKNIWKHQNVILLDNMDPKTMTDLITKFKEKGFYNDSLFEASGGINEDNLNEYAKTGVDIISMGCLTQKLVPLDFSMEVL